MKKLALVIPFLFAGISVFAQDIITKTDSTQIQAKIIEINPSQISYKKFSYLDGPLYIIDISDVQRIQFQNGEIEFYNEEEDAYSVLPTGVMTYNSWSGKISVGGETIENEMLDRFFTPEDLALFRRGKTLDIVGLIVGCIGAVPCGYGGGYLLGWHIGGGGTPTGEFLEPYNNARAMLIVGSIGVAVGLALMIPGSRDIKQAVANYNSSLTFSPTLHFGATQNGVGLALVF